MAEVSDVPHSNAREIAPNDDAMMSGSLLLRMRVGCGQRARVDAVPESPPVAVAHGAACFELGMDSRFAGTNDSPHGLDVDTQRVPQLLSEDTECVRADSTRTLPTRFTAILTQAKSP